MADRVEGGPGWHLDGTTLRPVLDDVEAFRSAHREDPAVEALVALWTGDADTAEQLLLATAGVRESPRLRALLADAWRDQGRTAEAVTAYEGLVAEAAGTGREAVLHQHLGKALLAAGRTSEALTAFEHALRLRVEQGAEASLVASSEVAVRRVRELLRGS